MRISDWSSDVCSSDLVDAPVLRAVAEGHEVMELKWARRRGFQWNKPGIAVIAIRLSLRRNDQPRFFARQRVIPSSIEPTPVEANIGGRSEERRVGKAWVRTCRSRWSPEH